MASINSSCWPTRSRLARSPRWLRAQPSREVCSLSPIARITTSARAATAAASPIMRRFSSGSAAVTSSWFHDPPMVIRQPSWWRTSTVAGTRERIACNTVSACNGTPLYPPSITRSAFGPMTAMVIFLVGRKGSMASFFNSVIVLRAASRARSRCDGSLTRRSASAGSTYGSSKSRIRNFARRTARTRSSITDSAIAPSRTRSTRCG